MIERIMITVPPTVGVTMRRTRKSQRETANWVTADTTSSEASVPGPPSPSSALMQNGMANAAVNIGSTAPAPTVPMRRTCSSVETPTTMSATKIIHVT